MKPRTKISDEATEFINAMLHKVWNKWCKYCDISEGIEQVALAGGIVFFSVMMLFASVFFWNFSTVGCLMGLAFTYVSFKSLLIVWREYKGEHNL